MNRRTPRDHQAARDARTARALLARRADRKAADAIRSTLSHRPAADAVALSEMLAIVAL